MMPPDFGLGYTYVPWWYIFVTSPLLVGAIWREAKPLVGWWRKRRRGRAFWRRVGTAPPEDAETGA